MLSSPQNNSDAVKTLYGTTVKDGLIYPIYWGRQLVWDGTAGNWGDDDTIPVGNNDYTMTDTNGTTVKAFCHIGKFPLGIADYTESSASEEIE